MKKFVLGAMAALLVVGAAIPAFAVNAQTSNEEFGRVVVGIPYTEAGETAVSMEEARKTGLDALAEFFGADFSQLEGFVVDVNYQPTMNPWADLTSPSVAQSSDRQIWVNPELVPSGRAIATIDEMPDYVFPMNVYRSSWVGSVTVPSNRTSDPEGLMRELFRFSIDTETGAVLSLQFFPSDDPTERIGTLHRENMGNPMTVFEYAWSMTGEHNLEYANHAMQLAEELNLFEGEVLRAAIDGGGWMLGRGSSIELIVSVVVECIDGEALRLTFQGRNRKELVDVNFVGRNIDHALNRDGSVTAPRMAINVGNPDSLFNFDWVNR